MQLKINSARITYPIMFGIPLLHALVLGLCAFFVDRFLMKTYDPVAWLLLLLFLGSLLLCDILLYRYQLFHRCYLKFQMDHSKIQWYIIKSHMHQLEWDEVRVFGVMGYDEYQPAGFIYFSANEHESNSVEQRMQLNNQRIVIEVRPEVIHLLKQYLPSDMQRIIKALENKQTCFYRRRSKRQGTVLREPF